MFITFFLIVLAGYLVGSIPTGYLVGKAKGIDLRKEGSGNIGATNALRVLGKKAGILVLLIDLLKGVAGCYLGIFTPQLLGMPAEEIQTKHYALMLAGGISAVIGHTFTCWLKFKGGKGVATTAGVFLAIVPEALIVCLIIFLITVFISHYVSLASILAAIALVPLVYFFHHDIGFTLFTALIAVLVIYRHRANIKRLINGTENKIWGNRK